MDNRSPLNDQKSSDESNGEEEGKETKVVRETAVVPRKNDNGQDENIAQIFIWNADRLERV